MGIDRKQIRWNGWGWAATRDELSEREEAWRWLAAALGMPALLATPPRPLDEIVLPVPRLAPDIRKCFVAILGADRVRQDDYERAFHARGASYRDLLHLRAGDLSTAPDAVLYPRGEDEVLAILKLAAQAKIPVIPYGGGTSVADGVTAGPGMITLDLSGLDRVITIDTVSGIAVAEAGIYGPALERALGARGMSLGHFPDSFEFSSLGGWIADGAAGQDQARHGGVEDWLCGARLATPQGVVVLGDASMSPPRSPLLKLLPGSQGLLGVMTQATVRIKPVSTPVYRDFLFRDFAAGCATIRQGSRAQIPFSMLRLCDAEETYFDQAFPSAGKPSGLRARIGEAIRAARNFGRGAALLTAGFPDRAAGRSFERLAKEVGALALRDEPCWPQRRFQAPYRRDALLDRGVGLESIESWASWSNLAALHAAMRAALERAARETAPLPGAHGLVLCRVTNPSVEGARLTFTILFPRKLDDEDGQRRAITAAARGVLLAHGKTDGHDNDQDTVDGEIGALRAVKSALDPDGILNPGKRLIPAWIAKA